MFSIAPTARLRPSPYFDASVAAGARAFTVYNRMLMPLGYGDSEAEYWRLIEAVSMWDVAGERQVQLVGPDAGKLAQVLTTRDLSNCRVGQGKYAPLCNHRGVLINDPVLLKLEEDRYWFSIADSNIWFWAEAIAAERGLRVEVSEPDVSPLAVQGPKAEDVVASLFGDWVRELRYFWFRESSLDGMPVVVARSGWSKQGGFEIYLMDGSRGAELWNKVAEAGQPFHIGPGAPNGTERVESGLLSYGGDTDGTTNPFEVRLGRFVDLHAPDSAIGMQALRRIAADGPRRHQLGVVMDGFTRRDSGFRWHEIRRDGKRVGDLTNCIWSRRMGHNVGFGLVSIECRPGDAVEVEMPDETITGTLCELPFL